jgi:hypothetical protein
LLPVFRIAPAGFVAGDVFLGDLAEGAPLGLGEKLRLSLGAFGGYGIGALAALRPVRGGLLPGPRQRDIRVGTEPMSRRLPSIWNRNTQDFAPVGAILKYSPPPSCNTAGPFAFATSTAESFPVRAMAALFVRWTGRDSKQAFPHSSPH